MAHSGIGYFDSKGQYYRAPEEATLSDLSALLGRVGEGDSLAPGIAKIILDRRSEIEDIFREHDNMIESGNAMSFSARQPTLSFDDGNIAQFPAHKHV
jgi:hypothetical protein